MERELLIREICRRVQERLMQIEQGGLKETNCRCAGETDCKKPGLLLIAQDHGEDCHPVLTCEELGEYYRVDCMLLQNQTCDVADYEGVIAYTLTNEALGKLANGIFDSDYTKAFGTALLLGKKIFIAEEEVELFRYRDTAPEGYYGRLKENLEFLRKNGVTIVPGGELVKTILGEQGSAGVSENEAKSCCPEPVEEKTVYLGKKVITERDMIAAREGKATCVVVASKSILTDLAKDYSKRYKIQLKREQA